MRAARNLRLGAILAGSLLAAAGCGKPPESFVERIDGVELSFVERYIATEWLHVFWNKDGTIDEFDFVEREVQNDDLMEVGRHPRLRVLKLGSTAISDAGLAHLANATELVMLGLRRTKVEGEGLKYLSGLKKLRTLLLGDTQVDDDALANLAGLDGLVELGLSNTRVTDAGMRHLQALPSLAALYVADDDVTEEGVRELRRTHPGIQIVPFDALVSGPPEAQ